MATIKELLALTEDDEITRLNTAVLLGQVKKEKLTQKAKLLLGLRNKQITPEKLTPKAIGIIKGVPFEDLERPVSTGQRIQQDIGNVVQKVAENIPSIKPSAPANVPIPGTPSPQLAIQPIPEEQQKLLQKVTAGQQPATFDIVSEPTATPQELFLKSQLQIPLTQAEEQRDIELGGGQKRVPIGDVSDPIGMIEMLPLALKSFGIGQNIIKGLGLEELAKKAPLIGRAIQSAAEGFSFSTPGSVSEIEIPSEASLTRAGTEGEVISGLSFLLRSASPAIKAINASTGMTARQLLNRAKVTARQTEKLSTKDALIDEIAIVGEELKKTPVRKPDFEIQARPIEPLTEVERLAGEIPDETIQVTRDFITAGQDDLLREFQKPISAVPKQPLKQVAQTLEKKVQREVLSPTKPITEEITLKEQKRILQQDIARKMETATEFTVAAPEEPLVFTSGGTKFTVVNSKEALRDFLKRTRRFPTTLKEPKPFKVLTIEQLLGSKLKPTGKIPEGVEVIPKEEIGLLETARGDLRDFTATEGQKVAQKISAKGQVGSVGSGEVIPTEAIVSPNKALEDAMNASKKVPFVRQLLSGAKERVVVATKTIADDYEPLIREHNKELIPEFRRFADVTKDVNREANDTLFAVMGDMLTDARPQGSKLIFERYIALQNTLVDARRGLSTFRNIPIEELEAEVARLEQLFTPGIQNSVNKHQQLVKLVWNSLVKRGEVEDIPIPNPWYFPNERLDYLSKWSGHEPYLPKRLRKPFRLYIKARVGSVRDINFDYTDVMHRLLSRVRLDESIEDFAMKIAEKTALTGEQLQRAIAETFLTSEAKVATKPIDDFLKPNRIFHLDGKKYKVWQFQPGNRLYPASTIEEDMIQRVIQEADIGLTIKDLAVGPKGGELIRKGLALGGKYKMHVLPENIAERLTQFKSPQGFHPVEYAMQDVLRWWKATTLNARFVPYQLLNLTSDLRTFFIENPKAVLKIPEAAKLTARALRTRGGDVIDDTVQRLHDERILEAGFSREFRTPIEDPRFNKFLTPAERIKNEAKSFVYLDPFNVISYANVLRESIPRVALYLDAAEKIHRGIPVKSKFINLKGIEMQDIPGVLAREVLVDYGKLSPGFRRMRLMFPFMTWYVGIARNYIKYTVNNPGNAAIQLGGMYAALSLWNNLKYPEIEKNHPTWLRISPHLNTGYFDDEGNNITVGLETPEFIAGELLGMNELVNNIIPKVARGEITAMEGAKEYLQNTPQNIKDNALFLLNPVVTTIIGLIANKDPRTGRTIVPSNLRGTPEARRRELIFSLENLFTPFVQLERAQNPLLDAVTFDPQRVFIKKSIPGSGETERKFDTKIEQQAILNSKKEMYRRKYIESQVKGDRSIEDNERKIIDNMEGARPTGKMYRNIRISLHTKAEIVKQRASQAKDPEERKRLIKEYYNLKDRIRRESFEKRSSKPIRPFIRGTD